MKIHLRHVIGLAMILMSVSLLAFMEGGSKKIEVVVIHTSFGDMTVRLYDETPLHRDNFLKLVKENFYDSLLFHRVIKDFMIQGGDPDSKNAVAGSQLGVGGPGYTIPAEIDARFIHKKGALSAARQGDQVNPEKASSGSQFYVVQGKPISNPDLQSMKSRWKSSNAFAANGYTPEQMATYENLGGTPHLDGDYTVFGEVIDGLNIIDSIAAVAVNRSNRPNTDMQMSMTIEKIKWP